MILNTLRIRKYLIPFFTIIFGLSVLYTLFSFLIYWDPTRLILARFKAKTPYTYEKVHQKFKIIDPTSFITVTNNEDIRHKRRQLQKLFWGTAGIPYKILPSKIQKDFHLYPTPPLIRPQSSDKRSFIALYDVIDQYKDIKNLKKIDRLTIHQKPNWIAFSGVFYPKTSNQRLLIYQNGFASTYHNQWRLIGDLVDKGFTVIAHNFRWYGVNQGKFEIKTLPFPLRGFIDPVIISVNYLTKNYKFKSIDMIGLSAGGWVTTIIAAIDTRISRSYPVSGIYPMYLREGNEFPLPNIDKIITHISSYLDLFILSASGPDRKQMQVFNQFDKCCFRGTKSSLYKQTVSDLVQKIGPGSFSILLDKTHARHKISRFSFNQILLDMTRND